MRAMSTSVFSVMVAALAACSGGADAGHERGACYANHTCEAGLTCLSDLCVAPPPVACPDVGDKLASFKLGNYAAPADRTKLVGELTGACDEARLTADEGKCIMAAKSRFELSRCPRPLLPEAIALANDKSGCDAVSARLETQAREEILKSASPDDPMVKALPQIVAAAKTACLEDQWPDAVKGCISDASSKDMDACFKQLSSAQRDGLTKRIGEIMKAAAPR